MDDFLPALSFITYWNLCPRSPVSYYSRVVSNSERDWLTHLSYLIISTSHRLSDTGRRHKNCMGKHWIKTSHQQVQQ